MGPILVIFPLTLLNKAVKCDRLLSVRSTRVFSMSVTGDHLVLVTPILPVSLAILDALHSFSIGEFFCFPFSQGIRSRRPWEAIRGGKTGRKSLVWITS